MKRPEKPGVYILYSGGHEKIPETFTPYIKWKYHTLLIG